MCEPNSMKLWMCQPTFQMTTTATLRVYGEEAISFRFFWFSGFHEVFFISPATIDVTLTPLVLFSHLIKRGISVHTFPNQLLRICFPSAIMCKASLAFGRYGCSNVCISTCNQYHVEDRSSRGRLGCGRYLFLPDPLHSHALEVAKRLGRASIYAMPLIDKTFSKSNGLLNRRGYSRLYVYPTDEEPCKR